MLSFSASITTPGGGDSLVVGDFNHDGLADIAHFAEKGRVAVGLSNGDGSFRQSSLLSGMTGEPWIISAGDANGDGNLDVRATGFRATSTKASKTGGGATAQGGCLQSCGGTTTPTTLYTSTWLGKGDGTFGPASTTISSWGWGTPSGPVNALSTRADFNRDRVIDEATIYYWKSPVLIGISLGNADGSAEFHHSFSIGADPSSIAAGDFDGDGWTDLIVANSLSPKQTLSVLFNDRDW